MCNRCLKTVEKTRVCWIRVRKDKWAPACKDCFKLLSADEERMADFIWHYLEDERAFAP